MSENIKRFPLDFEDLSGELETTDVVMIAKITGESYKAELKTLMQQYLSGGSSLIISATPPTGVEGAEWLSTNTGIRYTFLNNKWVEV